MPRNDVIVLGAGVVGLSTARSLAALGARVTLLDREDPGGIGSRAAAGVILPSIRLLDDPELLALAQAGKAAIAEEVARLGGDRLRRGSGVLRPAADVKTRDQLLAKEARAPGFLGTWRTAEEVFALEPVLTGAPIAGAFHHQDAHLVDPEAYLGALLHEVVGLGVEVSLGEAALEVRREDSGITVRTTARSRRADWVVIALGAWSSTLTGLPPLAVPVRPQRGQLLTVHRPGTQLTRIVSGTTYLAPWRNGEILIGATEEDAGFANHTTPTGMLHLLAVLARLAPSLRDARVVRTWSGLRSLVAGGRPLIGAYPGAERVILATGHAGQGILTGAITGRAVAELIEHGASATAAPFDPARALAATPKADA